MPTGPNQTLKRVAFVAMPFRVKPTGLAPGKGPSTVDFDALYHKAIFPALKDLGYMPVRADTQPGSVIIMDMLQQLVAAELVIADISIPNGNVYYEAGVRHAAKDTGCVLISADWARSLFDLKQITQLRYPLAREKPTEADYRRIADVLRDGIGGLAESEGPVFKLTELGQETQDGRQLDEVSSALFAFEAELRSATVDAENGVKGPLRELLGDETIQTLPTYALEELVATVRDHLNWGELKDVLERLPDRVSEQAFFLEQRAMVLGRLGKLGDAIGLLEAVAKKHGATPDRQGNIGGRYRELARSQTNRQKRRVSQSRAVDAYHDGMQLDLNEYYCAHKLLVALIERDRTGDRERAVRCAEHVGLACRRAQDLDRTDEWLDSTLLIHACFEEDLDRALELLDRILDKGWANWKLSGLCNDLGPILAGMSDTQRKQFTAITDGLREALPIPQEKLKAVIMPRISEDGAHYKKCQQVHARPAKVGEVVISVTEAGEETSNYAKADQIVIRALTKAGEQYLINCSKFEARYDEVEPVDDMWTLYSPRGEVRALEVTHAVTSLLDVSEEFLIIAPWKSEQQVYEGDYFAAPWPDLDEVYRIARSEFDQTYRIAEKST